MSGVAEAYAPPNGKKPKRKIFSTLLVGALIVTLFLVAISRITRDIGQYKRIGSAVLNYEQP